MRILLFFIDGLGLGPDDAGKNPLLTAEMPFIRWLLQGKSMTQSAVGQYKNVWLGALDATLGVEGIPQSATGQSSLFTGKNAAKLIGRHLQAFPSAVLRGVLAEESVLKRVKESGGKVTFANSFGPDYFTRPIARRGWHSASTLALLAAEEPLRQGLELVKEGKGVYHDITNQGLVDRGFSVPVIGPEEAGRNLAQIVRSHDWTLYEYFQTDRAGHAQCWQDAERVLSLLDHLIRVLWEELDWTDTLMAVVSDHGNVENLASRTHTRAPVPLLLMGKYPDMRQEQLKNLTDVAPFLLRQWKGGNRGTVSVGN